MQFGGKFDHKRAKLELKKVHTYYIPSRGKINNSYASRKLSAGLLSCYLYLQTKTLIKGISLKSTTFFSFEHMVHGQVIAFSVHVLSVHCHGIPSALTKQHWKQA